MGLGGPAEAIVLGHRGMVTITGTFIAHLLRFESLFRLATSLPHPVFRGVFLAFFFFFFLSF